MDTKGSLGGRNNIGVGDKGEHLDSADTWAISVDLEFDVAFITPLGTPGVPDDVVLGAIAGNTPSNGGDSMIKIGSTSCSILVDSGSIEEETALAPGRGVNGDGEHSVVESLLHISRVIWLNLSICGNADSAISSHGVVAWELLSSARDVWVLFVWNLVVSLQVFEHTWLKTAVASKISIALTARNNLLLGEVWKIVASSDDSSLDDSSRTEGIAGSTLTLVLDWVDIASGSPVDSLGCTEHVRLHHRSGRWTIIAERIVVRFS